MNSKFLIRSSSFWIILATVVAACSTTNRNFLVSQGNNFARDGMWREAAESYQEYLAKVDESDPAVHRNFGMVLVKLGSYKKASQHLESSLVSFDSDFETNFLLGESYRGQNLFSEAIFRYQKSLKIKPNEPRAMKALAWSNFRIRLYSECLSISNRLAKITPNDFQVQVIQARTLLKLGKPGDALTAIRAIDNRIAAKSAPYISSVEGDIYFETGDMKKASRAYRVALKTDPMLTGALMGLGKIALQDKDVPRATELLERAVRVNPKLAEAHYLLGKIFENSESNKSVQHFKSFYRLAANDPNFTGETLEIRNRLSQADRLKNELKK
jgi:tetratricopeptide (TPR) repeat protein